MRIDAANGECPKEKALRIVVPGWGIPPELYSVLNPDIVFDHGFFPSAAKSADRNADDSRTLCGDSDDICESPTFFRPENLGTADGFPELDGPYEIVAHSFGSFAALAQSEFRNKAERIIVLGGFAKFAESSDNPRGVPVGDIETMEAALKNDSAKLLKRFQRAVAFPERFRFPPIPLELDADKLLKGLEMLKNRDIRGDLRSIALPVFFSHGEKDAVVSIELARETASSIPRSTFTSVPDAGHAIPFTREFRALFPAISALEV